MGACAANHQKIQRRRKVRLGETQVRPCQGYSEPIELYSIEFRFALISCRGFGGMPGRARWRHAFECDRTTLRMAMYEHCYAGGYRSALHSEPTLSPLRQHVSIVFRVRCSCWSRVPEAAIWTCFTLCLSADQLVLGDVITRGRICVSKRK